MMKYFSNMLSGMFCLLIFTACDHTSNKRDPSLADVKPQSPKHTRVSLQSIRASTYPAKQWSVHAVAYYSPLDTSQPNATETTTSRKNCINQRYSLNIHLSPCTRTFDRTVERVLLPQQISADAEALYLDYFLDVQDQHADFRIESLAVTIKECPECQERSYNLKMSCWEGDVTAENIQTDFYRTASLVRFYPAKNFAKGAGACGLKKEEHGGSCTKESALKIMHGRFYEGDYVSSYQLLDSFPAIPTNSGGWIANEAHGGNYFQDICLLGPGESYDRADFKVHMDDIEGWHFLPDVEIVVYKAPSGKVCSIQLEGYGQFKTYTPSVRYFFSFNDEKLVLLKTEEPNNIKHSWRYTNGEPLEYIHLQDDNVAGDEEIRYWHRDAAREWPERMDYTPDFGGFVKQREFATYLLTTYGHRPSSDQ